MVYEFLHIEVLPLVSLFIHLLLAVVFDHNDFAVMIVKLFIVM